MPRHTRPLPFFGRLVTLPRRTVWARRGRVKYFGGDARDSHRLRFSSCAGPVATAFCHGFCRPALPAPGGAAPDERRTAPALLDRPAWVGTSLRARERTGRDRRRGGQKGETAPRPAARVDEGRHARSGFPGTADPASHRRPERADAPGVHDQLPSVCIASRTPGCPRCRDCPRFA